jgi:hypothetical protein
MLLEERIHPGVDPEQGSALHCHNEEGLDADLAQGV